MLLLLCLGRDSVERPAHELVLHWTAPIPPGLLSHPWSLGPRAEYRTAQFRRAMLMDGPWQSGPGPEPAREIQSVTSPPSHVGRPPARPDAELRPRTTHGSLGPGPIGPGSRWHLPRNLKASTRSSESRGPLSRPADPVRSGGRRRVAEHAARSRPCAVADGAVVQSGHPVRAVEVPD